MYNRDKKNSINLIGLVLGLKELIYWKNLEVCLLYRKYLVNDNDVI